MTDERKDQKSEKQVMNNAYHNGESAAFSRPENKNTSGEFGLTKREYLAAQALEALIASDTDESAGPLQIKRNAELAVKYADALLIAFETV